MRKLDTFNNASGINNAQRIIAGIQLRNGDKVSARRAAPITTVHTANDQVALANPKANAPIAINHTSKVIEISSNRAFH